MKSSDYVCQADGFVLNSGHISGSSRLLSFTSVLRVNSSKEAFCVHT